MATPTLTTANVVKRLSQAVANSQLGNAVRALFADVLTDLTTLTPAVVDCTASTLTVTAALHANKTITLNRAAGIAVVLPAATGTGNKYTFYVGTTFTGNCTIDTVGSDVMQGLAIFNADSTGDVTYSFPTTSSTDTLTMYTDANNTTGGIVGAQVELQDVASGVFSVKYFSEAGGTEVTPFS